MSFKECQFCNNNINWDLNDLDNFDIKKYYLLCKECIKNTKVFSKTSCKKLFLLDENDLKNLKLIYLNDKNKKKFYVYCDVEKVVVNKYGSLDKLKIILEKRSKKQEDKNQRKLDQMKKRKEELMKVLMENKLEFKNYGDCYSYICWGKPSINEIVNNEIEKLKIINNRRIRLGKELSKKKLKLDENNKICYNYIYNLSSKPIEDVVRSVEIDTFLKEETRYNEFIKTTNDTEKAKFMALKDYTRQKDKKEDIPDSLKNTIIIKFD